MTTALTRWQDPSLDRPKRAPRDRDLMKLVLPFDEMDLNELVLPKGWRWLYGEIVFVPEHVPMDAAVTQFGKHLVVGYAAGNVLTAPHHSTNSAAYSVSTTYRGTALAQTAYAATDDVLADFDRYLHDDWDGEGALGIAPDVIAQARRLLAALPVGTDAPSISPDFQGGISFEWIWDRDGRSAKIYLEILPSREMKLYWRMVDDTHDLESFRGVGTADIVAKLSERIASVSKSIFEARP